MGQFAEKLAVLRNLRRRDKSLPALDGRLAYSVRRHLKEAGVAHSSILGAGHAPAICCTRLVRNVAESAWGRPRKNIRAVFESEEGPLGARC